MPGDAPGRHPQRDGRRPAPDAGGGWVARAARIGGGAPVGFGGVSFQQFSGWGGVVSPNAGMETDESGKLHHLPAHGNAACHYWNATGTPLECHWNATGMPLERHWNP
eukprot:EG_transcript_27891